MSETLSRADLQKQYELVLQEYRFQVLLNWDRTKHYLIFNTAIFGAAVALYKDAKTWAPEAGVAVLLALAALNSFAGVRATELGQAYYRSIRTTKAELEKALGLADYAIVSTPGMRRDHSMAAAGTPSSGTQRFQKIMTQARILLWALCVAAALGSATAIVGAVSSCQSENTSSLPR